MASVLDELIVKIGLDGSAFNSDVARTRSNLATVGATARREAGSLEEYLKKTQLETGRRIQQTEEVGRKTAQQFSNVKNNILGLLGAITGAYGLQQFAKSIISGDAALGNFAKTLGVSVEQLGTWIEMGKRSGASAESVKQSFVGINQIQQEILTTGTSGAIPYFRAMGVALLDAAGRARPITDVLKDLSEFARTHPPEQVRSLFSAVGIPPEMIPLLIKGRGELEKLEVQLRSYGVATAKSAEEDQKFLNQLADLEQIIRDVGRTVLSDLLPGLTQIAGVTRDWILANKEWIEQDINKFFKNIGTTLGEIPQHFRDWKTGAETLAAYFAGPFLIAMMLGLGPVGAAIAAIIAGLALMKTEGWKLEDLPVGSPIWSGVSREDQLKHPNSPASIEAHGYPGGGSGSWLMDKITGIFGGGRTFTPTADTTMPAERRTFLDALSRGESSGDYSAKNPLSTAHGRYQFLNSTDAEVSARTGLLGQDPVSQDRKAWYLASTTYMKNTGRDLGGDLKAGGHEAQIADALKGVWPSLPGGSQQNTSLSKWLSNMELGRTEAPTGPRSSGPQLPPRAAIDPGYNLALRTPASATTNSDYSRSSTVETHVNGPINVQTSATDADGIAKGIGAALQRYAYVPQVNAGLA